MITGILKKTAKIPGNPAFAAFPLSRILPCFRVLRPPCCRSHYGPLLTGQSESPVQAYANKQTATYRTRAATIVVALYAAKYP